MAKKELNLLQLAAGPVAEASATLTEIVRRKFANTSLGSEFLDDMSGEFLSYSFAPNSTGAAHLSKKAARIDSSGRCPFIQ